MKTGIYLIKNLLNGKCYVGQSKDIEKRWIEHKNESKWGGTYLHEEMRKYGVSNFELNVLEECGLDELNDCEIYWISKLNTYTNGYNCTKGGGYNRYISKNKSANKILTNKTKFDKAFNDFIYYSDERKHTINDFMKKILSDLGESWIFNLNVDKSSTVDSIKETLKVIWNRYYCCEANRYHNILI